MTTTTRRKRAPAMVVRHGPKRLPRWSLGIDAMTWACTYLQQPDGPRAGEPWVFTDEQMDFLMHWYAVDASGAFRYRSGVLRRMKGWGKDPVGAVLCAIEFVGPCRFGGWRNREPVAVPQPSSWVQTAAVSKEQTRNTMVLFPSLFSKKALDEYSIDVGKEIIYAHRGRSQIQAVTSSPKTLEGARSTFVLMNETHLWVANNDGLDMELAIGRNTAKVSGRSLQITNAHRIGEGSTAERAWDAFESVGDAGDMLYDSLEVAEDVDYYDDEQALAGLTAARGDSSWVPVDRILAEMRDPRTGESVGRRFYFNQIRSEQDGWITANEWKDAERQEDVPPGTLIALGFDGSRFRDATALVGTVIATGYQWVIGAWERPELAPDDWEVPAQEVTQAVNECFSRWKVWRMYCDPYWWEETIATWAGKWGTDKVAFFHTNARIASLAREIKSFETGIRAGELGHEPDERFARHVGNAVKDEKGMRDEDGVPLYLIKKENPTSKRKIDIAMAAILSNAARNAAIADGVLAVGPSVYESRGVRRV